MKQDPINYHLIAETVWSDFLAWVNVYYDNTVTINELDRLLHLAQRKSIKHAIIHYIDILAAPAFGHGAIKFRYHTLAWVDRWKEVRAYSEVTDFASYGNSNLRDVLYPDNRLILTLRDLVSDYSLNGIKRVKRITSKKIFQGLNLKKKNFHSFFSMIEEIFCIDINSLGISKQVCFLSYEFLSAKFADLIRVSPVELLEDGGLSKVLKVVVGVVFYSMSCLSGTCSEEEINEIIFRAVKIGFYWGITYPLVDNLYDSIKMRDQVDLEEFNTLINRGILGEDVSNSLPNSPFIQELHDCCIQLKRLVPIEQYPEVYNAIKSFHQISIEDAGLVKSERNSEYDYYIKSIMKAGLVRVSAAGLSGISVDEDMVYRYFTVALHNQIEDDALDFFSDRRSKIDTSFVAFDANFSAIKINPLLRYLQINQYVAASIGRSEFCHVYTVLSSALAEMIKLHVIQEGHEGSKYFINRFCVGDIKCLRRYFDGLRNSWKGIDHISEEWPVLNYTDNHLDRIFDYHNLFYKFYSDNLNFIEELLAEDFSSNRLSKVMTYIIAPPAKRLRALLALASGEIFAINRRALIPLVKAVEYFHGASLAFDDLPSHDNALWRRGRKSAHLVYGEADTQLAAISLIAEGFAELSKLPGNKKTSSLIFNYAALLSGVDGLCGGQSQDIKSRQMDFIDISYLVETARKKTGTAIAFPLLVPAILARRHKDIPILESISMDLGVAYQIKDDIADHLGYSQGKDVGLDIKNNTSTFATLLGIEKATDLFYEFLDNGIDKLDTISRDASLLKGVFQSLRTSVVRMISEKNN